MPRRTRPNRADTADLLVVGSGLAGLSAAWEATAAGARVLVVTAGARGEGASAWAQGGIAVPRDGADVQAHVLDTLTAGRGVCDPAAVRSIVGDAFRARDWLLGLGMRFDAGFGREGGHSCPRILHRDGDRTGAHLVASVGRALAALERPPVVLESHRVVSLCRHAGRVTGALLCGPRGPIRLHARALLLATGGLGRLYARSTNPPGASGEGVALGVLAGAVARDMEFVQFHPTVLADGGLVTEAVRGAGARLVNGDGQCFMDRYDPAADLAPRDVVARAVWRESMLRGPVQLDLRSVSRLASRFPGLSQRLRALGGVPARALVPVAPAAHYAVGGLRTDLWGRTGVAGLYAAGEVASTGLHGANRLASNSMLEAVVMGRRAAVAALDDGLPLHGRGRPLPARGLDGNRAGWLPRAMEADAGLLRNGQGLEALDERLARLWDEMRVAPERAAVANHVVTARLIVRGAARRTESRGVHWRTDSTRKTPHAGHLEQWCEWDGAHGKLQFHCAMRPRRETAPT